MDSLIQKTRLFGKSFLIALLCTGYCVAREPTWSHEIIAVGTRRQQLTSLPIERRPYRPLHVYGNTVRRWYYRGAVLPTWLDVRQATRTLTNRFVEKD